MAIRVLFLRDFIEPFVSIEKFVFKAAAHLIFLQFSQFYKTKIILQNSQKHSTQKRKTQKSAFYTHQTPFLFPHPKQNKGPAIAKPSFNILTINIFARPLSLRSSKMDTSLLFSLGNFAKVSDFVTYATTVRYNAPSASAARPYSVSINRSRSYRCLLIRNVFGLLR